MNTTIKDFEYFKSRVYYWQDALKINRWNIYVTHGMPKCDINRGNIAVVYRSKADCTASIYLTKKDCDKYELLRNDLDRSAFHEMMEILLWDLGELAEHTFNFDFVSERKHEIIRVLENSVFLAMRDL